MRGVARDAVGIGLRSAHYEAFLNGEPAVEFVEVIAENFLSGAAFPLRVLDRVASRMPVVLHGVGLNLLGPEPLDEAYLDDLCRLADRVDAPYVSDHLCWTGTRARSHHDLLPVPFRRELVEVAAERASAVQSRLGRPFGLENLSSYVRFASSEMPEWAFVASVVRESGCHLMLDVNNVYVSSLNHGFDPLAYLSALEPARVLQVHVAGHDASSGTIVVDTHDRPVCDPVWALYTEAWRRLGPFPTLLERDANLPPLAELVAEAHEARGRR
jgi:uncharacterized protein (UPF0276 family)